MGIFGMRTKSESEYFPRAWMRDANIFTVSHTYYIQNIDFYFPVEDTGF